MEGGGACRADDEAGVKDGEEGSSRDGQTAIGFPAAVSEGGGEVAVGGEEEVKTGHRGEIAEGRGGGGTGVESGGVVVEEDSEDDDNYEITDFSMVTPWERLIQVFYHRCSSVLL